MPTVQRSPLRWHSAGGRNIYMVKNSKASDQNIMTFKRNQSSVLFGGYFNSQEPKYAAFGS